MSKTDTTDQELHKLYNLLEKIRNASLGADYQTRIQMRLIKEKALKRIQDINASRSK